MRGVAAAALAIGLVFAMVGGAAADSTGGAADTHGADLNAARVDAGLTPLARRSDLDAVAQRHADRMAASGGAPFHSGDPSGGVPGFELVGEIVGRTDSSDDDWSRTLTSAFLASTRHRDELLDPRYLQMGVGVSVGSGGIYVTGVLWQPASATPAAASVAAPPTPPVVVRRPVRRAVVPPPAPAPIPMTAPAAPPRAAEPIPVPIIAAPPSEPPPLDLVTVPVSSAHSVNPVVALAVGAVVVAALAPPSRRRAVR